MTARRPLSIALLAAGLLCLLLGTATLYARQQVLSAERLAAKAVTALDSEDVRDATAVQITEEVITKVNPDLVTARPLIEAGASGLVSTGAFKAAFRQGVEAAYGAAIDGDDDAIVAVANIGVLLDQALRRFQPRIAKRIPKGFDSTLIRIGESGVTVDAAQTVEDVRHLGLVLPPLGILLLLGSIAAAAERRRAVIWAGGGLVLVSLAAVVALFVAREVVEAGIEEETNRGAFDSIWADFLDPLRNWYLALGALGLIVASAASSALTSRDLGPPIRRGWELLAREPKSTRGKLIWAAALTALGLLMILNPVLVLQALVVIVGAYLVSRAVATVIALAEEPATTRESRRERRRILAWSGGAIGVAAALALFLVAALSAGEELAASGAPADKGCNGMERLCDRPLDRVSFAATHNSYAGATYPGFLFPEQDDSIPEQLEAGIRGLWIDTYYGIPGQRVYTDTSKVDPALIAQVTRELGPQFAAAGNRIRSQIARPPADAKPEIYLCHGFCELGAVSAEQTFEEVAEFMEENPNEVLIIDLEDYTTPSDTQALIESTGLVDYVYEGPQGPPWPTLQEMIDSGGRILLVAEHKVGGASWYRPLGKTIQETPFAFKRPSQMTCRGGRGRRSNTIFLINNWIDTDPTPKPSNAKKVNSLDFLYDRARRCERQRGLFANVLNVDFYLEGDVFGVVNRLNREGPKQQPGG